MQTTPYPRTTPPEIDAEALAATLTQLVQIDSVNPDYGGPAGGEARVIQAAADFLTRHGLEPCLSEAFPGRPNLRVRLQGEQEGPPLLFQTHIDTVTAGGMSIAPFSGEIREGRLWGRGSTDAKGQAAAMLHALAAWARGPRRPPRSIELALCVDEEFGFGGSHALVIEGIDAAGIIIGEPTELRPIITHKGVVRVAIEVKGKAAHACNPALGINAISGAAVLIETIDRVYLPDLATRRAPLLNPATMNIAKIAGGVQPNLIPPACRVEVERRLLPGETLEGFLAEMRDVITMTRARVPWFEAELEAPSLHASAFATPAEAPLAQLVCAVAAGQGLPAEPAGVDYATDACELVHTGLPIVVVGPGCIAQAHTADEFIELADLAAGARFYAALMGAPFEALAP